LDRLSREGVAATLGLLRRFHAAGAPVWSLREPWTETADPAMAELLTSIYAWMARAESARRSERVRAGLERRRGEGLPVGRQPGAADRKPRKRSGYVARWERERDGSATMAS
jgi:DNA invertase Pin-like site-specific DNA recombinase